MKCITIYSNGLSKFLFKMVNQKLAIFSILANHFSKISYTRLSKFFLYSIKIIFLIIFY
jgi:hypothetical protein